MPLQTLFPAYSMMREMQEAIIHNAISQTAKCFRFTYKCFLLSTIFSLLSFIVSTF